MTAEPTPSSSSEGNKRNKKNDDIEMVETEGNEDFIQTEEEDNEDIADSLVGSRVGSGDNDDDDDDDEEARPDRPSIEKRSTSGGIPSSETVPTADNADRLENSSSTIAPGATTESTTNLAENAQQAVVPTLSAAVAPVPGTVGRPPSKWASSRLSIQIDHPSHQPPPVATTSKGRRTPTGTWPQPSPTVPLAVQDQHPYPRGSVIEVWHVAKKAHFQAATADPEKEENDDEEEDEWWWSDDLVSTTSEEDSQDDDDDNDIIPQTNKDEPDDHKKISSDHEDMMNQTSERTAASAASATEQDQNRIQAARPKSASSKSKKRTVRLCDVIDRAQNGPHREWRYYVHYRDFNRRMDEWIGLDRIVSPPSVGNAKARALKREEERLKKKRKQQQLRREEKMSNAELMDWTGPRSRRRTAATPTGQTPSSTTSHQLPTPGTTISPDASAATAGVPLSDEADTTPTGTETAAARRTRFSRRKTASALTVDGDEGGVGAGGPDEEDEPEMTTWPKSTSSGGGGGDGHGAAVVVKKEVLALPTDAVLTQRVGEHVVASIKAQELDEHEGLDEAALREHEEVTKVKNVSFLELGPHRMETWYFSPLPKELVGEGGCLEVLYVCEFTLRMFARKSELLRFQARLPVHKRHPPGNEIYRKGHLAMFEVDGQEEEIYSQNLCYIAKLFLDHKTLFYSSSIFLFFVLCELDERGYHPVGYYSKEKYSDVGYNLACILTFPAHQRKGYGRFLISFSYELSKKEEKVGSPEKPMSDLGQQAYKPYWASTIVDFLLNQSDESSLSIMDIAKKTSIMAEDIVFTLNQLGLLKIINGVYFIVAEKSLLEGLAKKYPIKEPRVDPSRLHWTPYLTDVKRDKFSIHSKKQSLEAEDNRVVPGA